MQCTWSLRFKELRSLTHLLQFMPEPLSMRDRRSLRRIAGLDTLGTRRATSRETMRETKRATVILGLLGTIRIQGFGGFGLRVKRIQTSLKIIALVCWLFLLGSLVVSVVCDVFFFFFCGCVWQSWLDLGFRAWGRPWAYKETNKPSNVRTTSHGAV